VVCVYGVLCGYVSWTAVCMGFYVDMLVGLQYVWGSMWICKLDCSMYVVLCGDVSWTAVCMGFCVRWTAVCMGFCVEM
jgi:hypothetical protein